MKDSKNFYIFTSVDGSVNCYKILASSRISHILGREVVASCCTEKDAQWLCGVLECYWLLCGNIASSISKAIK